MTDKHTAEANDFLNSIYGFNKLDKRFADTARFALNKSSAFTDITKIAFARINDRKKECETGTAGSITAKSAEAGDIAIAIIAEHLENAVSYFETRMFGYARLSVYSMQAAADALVKAGVCEETIGKAAAFVATVMLVQLSAAEDEEGEELCVCEYEEGEAG